MKIITARAAGLGNVRLALSLMILGSTSVASAQILDESYTDPGGLGNSAMSQPMCLSPGCLLAQTFTVGVSGRLNQVSIGVSLNRVTTSTRRMK